MQHIRYKAILLAALLSIVTAVPSIGVNAYQRVDDRTPSSISSQINGGGSSAVRVGWVRQGNSWLFYTASGRMQTGWAKINGKWYYFAGNGVMTTGWQKISGKWYYMGSSGQMQTGWQKIHGKWYYLDKSGAMKTGWNSIGGKWYYMNGNGQMQTGWQKIGGKWYYLGTSGGMFSGPHVYRIGSKYYFFEAGGALTETEGWKKSNLGNWFYSYNNGTVAVNTSLGSWYIGDNGVASQNAGTVMDQKAQGYSSNTNYLILANKTSHKMCIYKGSKGKWKRIKGPLSICCGRPGHATPSGVFRTSRKQYGTYGWKVFGKGRACYVYSTSSSFYLHSIIYSLKGGNVNPAYVKVKNGTLGKSISNSCLRLSTSDARWIFNNIPRGTRLVVYETN